MLPVLEVSRLSSASSFYSAVTHSLGLGYLPDHNTPASAAASTALVKHNNPVLTFGDEYSASPVFQVRQVDNRPLQPASIVLSANSLDAVNEFHAAALRAFPRSAAVIGTKESLNPNPESKKHIIPSVDDYFSSSAPHNGPDSSTIVARVTDFDGNIMAVEYYPYQQSSSSHYGRGRSSGHYETSRVLDYSPVAPATSSPSMFSPRYGSSGATALTTGSSRSHHRGTVATSEMPASYYDRYSSSQNDRMGTLRRSATSASAASYESDPSTSSSNKGVMGAFGLAAAGAVGAMAGAAITYTVMRSRSRSRGATAREYPYDYDANYGNAPSYEDAVPAFQRRETAPAAIGYEQYPDYAGSRYRDNGGMRTSRTRSIASQKDLCQVEDVYDYKDAASVAPPPSYHTSARYSSKAPSTHGRSRSRSEAPVGRAPLLLTSGSEKGAFDGYDYGNGYDAYEKGGYEKSGYEKSGYEKSGYEKSGYAKSSYDKSNYDKSSYVSARTERTSSRVPPNSSRSAPVRAPSYAPSHGYSQQPSQAPSRRSRSSSRSRSHSHAHGDAYDEYAAPESHATMRRSGSSRAPPPERAESQATLRNRSETMRSSSGRKYSSQSHSGSARRAPRPGSGSGNSHSRWEDEDRYGGDGYDDDDGDADSVAPDDSISCVGIRNHYR